MKKYKPEGYNDVSPYFVIHGAQKLMDMLTEIFGARELRRYDLPDGTIMHAEVRINDSVIMVADASDQYPANPFIVHVYVQDVDSVYQRAMAAGCEAVEEPKQKEGDPDRRGSFKDFGGNTWAIGTQLNS